MFDKFFNFSNKKDRDDLIYSIIVIIFFAFLFWWILFKENKLPSLKTEIANINTVHHAKASLVSNNSNDTDLDGVIDEEDICPLIAGLPEFSGCPHEDMDGDGIINSKDNCPRRKGIKKYIGCPDKHPTSETTALVSLTSNQLEKEELAIDTDGDGINDIDDKCPNTFGTSNNNGCPEVDEDTDGDGILDSEDNCPNEAGIASNNGCPSEEKKDSDGDGVIDSKDRCPNEVGPVTNFGCPKVLLKEEESADVEEAIKSIQFYYNSSRIRSSSFISLNNILKILENYPSYKLDIIGHTDNKGNANDNMKLSDSRAKACYRFFIQKGINKARLNYEGKGETEPIKSNDNVIGRNQNRRVEFFLKK